MKYSHCGHWNSVSVFKIFLEQTSPEPKVKVMIPMYEPLQISKCGKCGKIIAEPKGTNQNSEWLRPSSVLPCAAELSFSHSCVESAF